MAGDAKGEGDALVEEADGERGDADRGRRMADCEGDVGGKATVEGWTREHTRFRFPPDSGKTRFEGKVGIFPLLIFHSLLVYQGKFGFPFFFFPFKIVPSKRDGNDFRSLASLLLAPISHSLIFNPHHPTSTSPSRVFHPHLRPSPPYFDLALSSRCTSLAWHLRPAARVSPGRPASTLLRPNPRLHPLASLSCFDPRRPASTSLLSRVFNPLFRPRRPRLQRKPEAAALLRPRCSLAPSTSPPSSSTEA